MDVFLKLSAGVLTALILWICIAKQGKEYAVLLTLAVCAMVIIAAFTFLQPVISFLKKLQSVGNLDEGMVSVILKAVGIGLVGEITVLICKDAGNESMGKALQILVTMVILCLSVPVFEKLLSLLDKILGTI